jgi:probable phosphoglycerate mutase
VAALDPGVRLIYVARHGETDWNAVGRWQGHTDVPLNDTGRQQARELAATLQSQGLRVAASSDLSRARETAQIVAAALGLTFARADADLRERSFGIFEGLTRAECAERYPSEWAAWEKERRAPGGAESQVSLAARVHSAAQRIAMEVAADDAPALIVTHGGALRALVQAVTGEMPPFVKNGEVWRLVHAGHFVEARRA